MSLPQEPPEGRRRLLRLGFGLGGLRHMLGILNWTLDEVCAYAEYIRLMRSLSTPYGVRTSDPCRAVSPQITLMLLHIRYLALLY